MSLGFDQMSPNLVQYPWGRGLQAYETLALFNLRGLINVFFCFKIPPNCIFATSAGFNRSPKIPRGFEPPRGA